MSVNGQVILGHLGTVEALRSRQRMDGAFAARVLAVKQFQHARFEKTYADLRTGPFSDAASFFLEDLYGPHDFSERDAQFARIVPALVRLFPADIVGTVSVLAELHALSETLDSDLAMALDEDDLDVAGYRRAWQRMGKRPLRLRQISLMLTIGRALQRYTRSPFLRGSLRLMRQPAKAAGLAALQRFLERGFDTFGELGKESTVFLDTIADREATVVDWLFDGTVHATPPGF